jgi:serine/threonine protein kinase
MLPAQSASADVSMHSSPLSLAPFYNIPAHRLALDMPTFPRNETSGTIGNASLAGCAEAKSRYLCDEIMALLKENWIGLSPEGQYVPDAKLAELLTESSVHDALGGTDRPLTLFVIGEATQVFATLLLVFADWKRRAHAMRYFQGTYFTDEKLRNQISGVSPHCPLHEHGACQHHFPRELWEEKDVAHFKSQRWNFLLHSFNHLVFQDEIDINQLLPFVRKVPHNELNHGNFSEVTCVQMLASKQTKKNCQSELISVALKTLKRIDNGKYDIDKEWRRESQAYKHLNDRSPHIIEAIAAVRQVAARPQNDVYHFVLEWADGGSLHNFIEEHPESQLKSETHHDVEQTRKRVMQMLEQLCGLADALHSMHITTIKSPRSSQQVTLRPSLVPPSGHTAPGAVPNLADSPMPFTGEALPIIEVHASEEPQVDRGYTSNIQYSRPEAEGLSVSAGTSLRRWGSDIHSSNWRHGDIKPENILRFIDGKEDAWIGTLKLADLGRAQQHQLKTILRETKETELWRTRWYEPPDLVTEVHDKAEKKISRLFDVWSIGCVIFETVLWMLYGKVSIADFLQANELAPNEQDATPYWRKMAPGDYRVTDAATSWMDHVLQIDSEGDCALGHLVRVVKDRLLKIDLPPDTDEFSPGFRTNAGDLREQLRQIIDRGHENEEYLFSGADRSRIPRPSPRGSGSTIPVRPKSRSLLAPDDAEGHRNKRLGGSPKESPSRATMIAQQRVYTNQLDDRWRGSNDDNFIRSVLLSRQATSTESDLCDTCRGRDILASQNSFDVMNNLDCTLCTMVSDGVGDLNTDQDDLVSLERVMDSLVLRGTKTKILRLFRPEAGE